MSGMAPEINWGFSSSIKVNDLERRVKELELEVERLKRIIAHLVPDRRDDI